MFNSGSVDELISMDDFLTLVEESQVKAVFDRDGMTSRRLTHPRYGSLIAIQSVATSNVLVLKV